MKTDERNFWPRCDICHKNVGCWHNKGTAPAYSAFVHRAGSAVEARRRKWKLAKRKARAAARAALVGAIQAAGARAASVVTERVKNAIVPPQPEYVNEYARSIGEALSAGFKQGWADAHW